MSEFWSQCFTNIIDDSVPRKCMETILSIMACLGTTSGCQGLADRAEQQRDPQVQELSDAGV